MKTGLDQDDSQICVGFNIILASLEAGADVTVVFDAGALLDLTGKTRNLESTGVPILSVINQKIRDTWRARSGWTAGSSSIPEPRRSANRC